MPRLVAFGCSYTKGWALPDQWEAHDYDNINPSNLAWPKLLGDLLKVDTVNMGKGGNCNIRILYDILNFDFNTDDIVIVGWSYFHRTYFTQMRIKYNPFTLESPPLIPHKSVEEDNIVKNYIFIYTAHLYLTNKKIINFGLPMINDYHNFKVPEYLNSNCVITDFSPQDHFRTDTANDKKHPGPKTHALLAEMTYNRIKDHVIY